MNSNVTPSPHTTKEVFLINLLFLLVPLLFLAVFYFITGWLLARKAIHPQKVDYGAVQGQEMQRNHLDPALLDLKYDKIFHTNSRGLELVGRLYCTPTQTNRYILFNHGYNYPWISALKYLPMLLGQGFNVLVPDHEGEGESRGEYITFGCYESLDSLEWLEELKKHAVVNGFMKAEIGVMGESMGAVISLLMAAKSPDLLFCIADCPFSDWDKMMELETRKKYHFSAAPFLPAVRWAVKKMSGADMKKVAPLQAAEQLKIPTLLIHGTADPLVPCSMSQELAAKNPCIRLYLQEGAKHMNSYASNPAGYQEQVSSFLETIRFESEHLEEFIM